MLTPRQYQTTANSAAWQYLADKPGNPLIVLPTGAGKSLVIAMLVSQARSFGGRVVVLAHRKELITQNAMELQELMPDIPIGIYSAGLKSRNTTHDVIIGGIQSIYTKAEDLGARHLIIVDEAHLISEKEESMYGRFLKDVIAANPSCRVVGLTATPYRTGEGPLCGKDKLFQRICFEAHTHDLIAQGFLCPITNKPTEFEVDTSKLALRGGEIIESDMQRLFDTFDNVGAACGEIIKKCHDRHSVLIFSSGVTHAAHIVNAIEKASHERCGMITGDTMPLERSTLIGDFKNLRLRWLINVDVLTTGFNAKCIDAIAVLRTTMSPGLFAQICGRGLRVHESKTNCLILDFGENIKRHGSIDDPNYGRASEIRRGSGAQTIAAANNGRGKPCPNCGIDVAANARECGECGFSFPVKHEATADTESQLSGPVEPESWIVENVYYRFHAKKNHNEAMPTLRVSYECRRDGTPEENLNHNTIDEWVCLEHKGFAKVKAGLWWQARSECMEPDTIKDALDLIKLGVLRDPCKIVTVKDGKWYRIKSVEFDTDRPTELQEAVEVKEFSGEGDDVPF